MRYWGQHLTSLLGRCQFTVAQVSNMKPKIFFALSKKSENHSDTWKIFWHVSFFVHGSNERKVKVIPVFEIFLCKIQNRLHSIVMCTNEDSQKYFVLTSLAIWLLRCIWIWIWIQLQQFFWTNCESATFNATKDYFLIIAPLLKDLFVWKYPNMMIVCFLPIYLHILHVYERYGK